MSGGHWEYQQYKLKDILDQVKNDSLTKKRFQKLSIVLGHLSDYLADIIHELDWDFSGDSIISNDQEFETLAIKKLRDVVSDNEIDKTRFKNGRMGFRINDERLGSLKSKYKITRDSEGSEGSEG